ncbi:hypothetical protein EVAR_48301_1 [Eumeta japonica]|uniref:Uncharacterized protein n=1 Tax=Eumeta variegata TaxID=151549 RepID=A0A4C1WJT3_EUMVA|nr:hypothetical protein EVAR_48301_1 [Eumeta japonica]
MFRLIYCSTSFTNGGQNTTATDALFFCFSLRGEGDKKPNELPTHPPYAVDSSSDASIDIQMPSARDSPTCDSLGSPRHRESRKVSTRVGTFK